MGIATERTHTETTVVAIPSCDVCSEGGRKVKAYADARTPYGWAYVCKRHFDYFGCTLGLGKGQRLVIAPPATVDEITSLLDSNPWDVK